MGVATDHAIEWFRNRLLGGLQDRRRHRARAFSQFHPIEQALAAMGVVGWPIIELQADDALAPAAHLAMKDKKVERAIWTPDKDLAQCVRGTRAVQIDGRRKTIRDDGWEMRKVWGQPASRTRLRSRAAADGRRLPRHRSDRPQDRRAAFEPLRSDRKPPADVLGEQCNLALLFKNLATLRTDTPLFEKIETLRWRSATPVFAKWAKKMEAPRLLNRYEKVADH